MWTLTGPTLTNKAGLWKSDYKWNLIPLEPEIFNSTDDKGELDFFLIVKEYINELIELVTVVCQIVSN